MFCYYSATLVPSLLAVDVASELVSLFVLVELESFSSESGSLAQSGNSGKGSSSWGANSAPHLLHQPSP